jgi:hypothetical protein
MAKQYYWLVDNITEARRRQQGSDSPDSYASTGLKRSSDGHDIT